MSDNPIKRLLVDLDCLLDTRIATVAKIHPEASRELLGTEYLNRDIDDFELLTKGLVSNESYKEAYAKRDKETLLLARPTKILKLLNEMSIDLEKLVIDTPFIKEFKIVINYYPYELNDKEQEELIEVLYEFVTSSTRIELISKPLEEVTPSLIKSKYDAFIIYEFDKWFSYHQDVFNTLLMPTKVIFAPALYIKKPTEEELNELAESNLTPFSSLELSVIERFSLELIKVREFSLELLK